LSVGSAMRAVIKRFTESMYWVWNGVPIAVGYAEPFSVILDNALGLVEACLGQPQGAGPYGFHEEDLITEWSVAWANGDLRIDAKWHSAPGGVEVLLRERSRIEMPLDRFVAEWKMPFRRILDALDGRGTPGVVGVKIEEAEQEMLARLRAAETAIPTFGWLYRDDH